MERRAYHEAIEAIAASERVHFQFPDRVREACERSRQEAALLLANPPSDSRLLHRGRIALRRYLNLAAALDAIYPPPAVNARKGLWNRAACLGQIHDPDKLIRRLKPGREGGTAAGQLFRDCSRGRARLVAKIRAPAAMTAMMRALAGDGPERVDR